MSSYVLFVLFLGTKSCQTLLTKLVVLWNVYYLQLGILIFKIETSKPSLKLSTDTPTPHSKIKIQIGRFAQSIVPIWTQRLYKINVTTCVMSMALFSQLSLLSTFTQHECREWNPFICDQSTRLVMFLNGWQPPNQSMCHQPS